VKLLDRLGLTEREAEVLRLVAQGLGNDEIAQRLRLTAGTIKVHLHRAFGKIGARDRTQAALFVVHHKL
jgi:DNA-binding NarL/FixJ family response regulator